MKKYIIKIFNGSDVKIYDELIEATDENEAIKKVLDDVIIYDGDRIAIDEV